MTDHIERRNGGDRRAHDNRRDGGDRRDGNRSHRLPRRVRGDRRERNQPSGRRATD